MWRDPSGEWRDLPALDPDWTLWGQWVEGHTGPGHERMNDPYRAPCRPEALTGGCRNCGTPPTGRKRYYCSDDCREEFERDHFWQTARSWALRRASVFRIDYQYVRPIGHQWATAFRCARCGCWIPSTEGLRLELQASMEEEEFEACWTYPLPHLLKGPTPEVNHIDPVNGLRENFSCHHHQENLEVLHHVCHVEVTNEQRAAGLIGH